MISSRKIEHLHPKVQTMAIRFKEECAAEEIDILITCTWRDNEEQDRLYARGRTVMFEDGHKVGIVTNAKAGQSLHNYGLALDVVPMRGGKPVWGQTGADAALWERVGAIAERVGFEWAGRWKRFRELPHLQYTGGHPLSHFQRGGTL